MKLTLTFMNREYEIQKDFQLNSQQKIIDTLLILQNADMFGALYLKDSKVKSLRRGVYINKRRTYEEEQIYNGDVLELC